MHKRNACQRFHTLIGLRFIPMGAIRTLFKMCINAIMMGNIMASVNTASVKKMGLVALTLVTASNMMGSGVFMLPTNLAGIGSISLFGWVITIVGVIALALVFAKNSMVTPRDGGIIAYASDAFGPFIGFQTTICYWISAWVGNVALLVAGVGYLSYFFPILKDPLVSSITAIVILWGFIALASLGARVAGRSQSFTACCMLVVVLASVLLAGSGSNPRCSPKFIMAPRVAMLRQSSPPRLWLCGAFWVWNPQWCPADRWKTPNPPCPRRRYWGC
ncbi:Arginine/agmatine antiporter [Serratia fonticola]|uniref:Arginine/agmatine antiporter n=1 Tax=Serratia fonticola TaxID=47917 RepID=A0A4U9VJR2_SERFO|nr:Arginine/agmatine antiporter [Serratia fonticola]